ncbi:hypothetical protein [Nitrosomonas communis]|uniref:hypothetical protein n=1 Tax=Nitrosomonas communis TaxID=44574 RepID=UPI0026EC2195|nr:hypothetical protein [Nitrosomonas communis]MCO6428688.1 hypothetical protein [Nitrosomonas communis]
MEITCYRDPEISRESRFLSANTYNLACQLLARCTTEHLFVPIRSMQYLAILDKKEFVFIDGDRKCWIDIAWLDFHPQDRTKLNEPVAYEVVYYKENQVDVMLRLQKEFPKALQLLAGKQAPKTPARVIKFPASYGLS